MSFAQTASTEGFSPKEIRPGDSANYRIVLKNLKGAVRTSDIPFPSGLSTLGTSQSQNYSLINGRMSSSITFDFAVAADKEGVYTVPAWKLSLDSKTFVIPAASLKVSALAPAQQQSSRSMSPFGFPSAIAQSRQRQQSHAYDDSLKNSIKLELKLPREKIYVGETIKCELVFSCDKSLFNEGYRIQQIVPQIKNIDAFECPAFTTEPVVDLKSNPQKALVIYQTVITPLKAGSYNLEFSAAGVLRREISIDDLMNMSAMDRMLSMGSGRQMRFDVPMEPLKINVLSLPSEGKPKHFTGAIGKFALAEVSVSPDAISVGEPCTIVAKIVGTGNFNRINAPALVGADKWKTYKPKSSFVDESGNHAYIGFKTFEYTVVPTVADLANAPQIDFNYFDPETAKYVEQISNPISVSVAPTIRSKSVQQANAEKKSPAPAFSEIAEGIHSKDSSGILSSPLFWLSQAAILAAIIIFAIYRSKIRKLEMNPAYAKSVAYTLKARTLCKQAVEKANQASPIEFFADACSALRYAISADTPFEAEALSLKEAEKFAAHKNLSPKQIAQIQTIFNGSDAIAFGGTDAAKIDFNDLAKNLPSLVEQILKSNEKHF